MSDKFIIAAIIYLAAVSAAAVIMTVADKAKAVKHKFRISEKALFIVAALGGSVAELVTMKIIRHKTLHKRFMIGLPAIIIVQIIIIVFVLYKTGSIPFINS